MTATKGFIFGAATSPLDTRKADASKLVTNADGTARIGVLGANPSIVVADPSTAPMRIGVQSAGFATQRAGGDGAAMWTNDGLQYLTVTKPGTQSWITTVYAKHDDTQSGDADNLPIIGTVTGVAAAIPTEAAIPAGALKLATVLIPSTATSTQSAGVLITNVYPMTAFVESAVPFRTAADVLAWSTARPSQLARVIGGEMYVYTGATNGWQIDHPFAMAAGGQVSATFSNQSTVILTVTFPAGRFTQQPIVTPAVLTSPGTGRKLIVQATGISATGFQLVVTTGDQTTVTTSVSVGWIAVQMTAASAAG